jgi:signal transduction histidine kinase
VDWFRHFFVLGNWAGPIWRAGSAGGRALATGPGFRVPRALMAIWLAVACALHMGAGIGLIWTEPSASSAAMPSWLWPVSAQLIFWAIGATLATGGLPLCGHASKLLALHLVTGGSALSWLLWNGSAQALMVWQGVNAGLLVAGAAIAWAGLGPRAEQREQLRVTLAERHRIVDELHDGVGSRLVTLLASQDLQDPAQRSLSIALQECLLDLQMTVDELGNDLPHSIIDGLARLRYRVQPALERLGIALDWNVQDPAIEAAPLSGAIATQVCKIAQEVLSNVLRHSQASRIEVTLERLDNAGSLLFEVRDNGCGLPRVPARETGRGLISMRTRAELLGGHIVISSVAPHGTCVQLVLPHEA